MKNFFLIVLIFAVFLFIFSQNKTDFYDFNELSFKNSAQLLENSIKTEDVQIQYYQPYWQNSKYIDWNMYFVDKCDESIKNIVYVYHGYSEPHECPGWTTFNKDIWVVGERGDSDVEWICQHEVCHNFKNRFYNLYEQEIICARDKIKEDVNFFQFKNICQNLIRNAKAAL